MGGRGDNLQVSTYKCQPTSVNLQASTCKAYFDLVGPTKGQSVTGSNTNETLFQALLFLSFPQAFFYFPGVEEDSEEEENAKTIV